MQQQQMPATFSTLQKQGVARPPAPGYAAPTATTQQPQQAPNKPLVEQVNGLLNKQTGGQYQPQAQPGFPYAAGEKSMPILQQATGQMGATTPQQYQGPAQVETAQQMTNQPNQPPPQTTGQQTGGNTGQQLHDRWQNQQPAQQFVPGQNPFSQQTGMNVNNAVNNAVNNPSPYSSDAYRQNFNYSSGLINQDFQNQQRMLNENMARMGFGQSTLAGQKYSDLGTEQARALTGMNVGLLNHMADTYGSDRAGAINAGMNWQGQQYGQDANAFGLNQQAQNQNFQQNQQLLGNWLDYGQQDFNNQMSVNQFNAGQQNQNDQLMLQMMGYFG
jgi:hypothetical protein